MTDQLKNCFFLFRLLVTLYVVDFVINVGRPWSEAPLAGFFGGDGAAEAGAEVKRMAFNEGKGHLEICGPDAIAIVELHPLITPQNAQNRELSPFR